MIRSILNKENTKRDSPATISVELSPDFGWSIGDQRVFGPGTSLQGYVIVECKETLVDFSQLRIHFRGVETMLSYDVGPGMFRTHTYDLFKTASTLWRKDEGEPLIAGQTYRFQFNIQMPMVQYPPTFQHHLYNCYYVIFAYLEPKENDQIALFGKKHIRYIPLIETRQLKSPLLLEDSHKKIEVMVKLDSREYMPGDMIKIVARATSHDTDNSKLEVNVRLFRILTFLESFMYPIEELVDASTTVLKEGEENVYFHIDSNLAPTVDYGSLMRLTYQLKIKANIKKSNSKLSLKWPGTISAFKTPILIGTLGSGVHVVNELSIYSQSRSSLRPTFEKNIVYEDTLPQYEPSRLPCYNIETR